MAKHVARSVQVALTGDIARNVPNPTMSEYIQPDGVKGIKPTYAVLEQNAIANSAYARPLNARTGVWTLDSVESFALDVRRNFKEMAAMFGAYDAGGYPIALGGGAIEHQFVLSTTRLYFTGVYVDEDLSVYTHVGQEPAALKLVGEGGYVMCEQQFFGTHPSFCQLVPTFTGGGLTYDGRLFARGKATRDSDAAAQSFDIAVDTLGNIGNLDASPVVAAVAKIKTKHSTDAGYSAAELVYANKAIPVRYGSGGTHGYSLNAEAGPELIFTKGTAGGVGIALAVANTWTLSSRGTVPSPSIPSGNTVFVPRKYEATVTLDGANLRKPPKRIEINILRGIRNDDHGWTHDISLTHPLGDGFLITGSILVEREDQEFVHKATNLGTGALIITFVGDYIGATAFRQTWRLNLDTCEFRDFAHDLQRTPRIPVNAIPFQFRPTDPSLLTGVKLYAINTVANGLA